MIQCRRLAYAVLSSPNVDRQAGYYQNVLGLRRGSGEGSRAVLSTQQGLECIVLEGGERAELTGLAFESRRASRCRRPSARLAAPASRPRFAPDAHRVSSALSLSRIPK